MDLGLTDKEVLHDLHDSDRVRISENAQRKRI